MTYDYSSVQVNLPGKLAARVISWGRDVIPDDTLSHDPDSRRSGREDEMHVTVLYGLHSPSPSGVRLAASGTGPFTVELKAVSLFTESDSFDVVKLDVVAPALNTLHSKLRDGCPFTSRFASYRPHVTIAYVKKGTGWACDGCKKFDGELFEATRLIFSSKSGEKTEIALP